MKKNIGAIDKIIRLLIAAIILILIVIGVLKGLTAIILGVIGGILLLTAIFGFCGLYALIGYSSCPEKKAN